MTRKPCKACKGEKYIHTRECKRDKGCLNGGSVFDQGCTCIPKSCHTCDGTGDSRKRES